MNQRNVDALTKLIEVMEANVILPQLKAEFLAEHGVLLPSSLTDEECNDLWYDGAKYVKRPLGESDIAKPDAANIRTILEQIAKG